MSRSDEQRFSIFSADGKHQGFVAGDLLGSEDIPYSERLKATDQAILVCTWPDRGFVIAHIDLGRIEFYDEDASLVRIAEVPFPSHPHFGPDQRGEIRFFTRRDYYRGCTANREFLFALFSGRLEEAYEGDSLVSAEFVHVFSWDGKLRSVFQMDRDIHKIGVDPEGTVLFGASRIDAGIYRFDLPSIPGG